MIRRGLALGVTALLMVAGAAVAPPARAVKPSAQGWWRASLNLLGVDLTAIIDPSTVDVPSDGLLVMGGQNATQPQAIAAVTYPVSGDVAGPLRLLPHAATATVPGSGAMACPLDNPTFKPAQGGIITDAPKYDCLGAVTATVDANGAYVFDVTTLVRGDVVAVAILPTTTTSRIVFAAPADDSLPVKLLGPGTAAAPAAPGPLAVAGTAGVLGASTAAGPGQVKGMTITAPSAAPAASAAGPTAVAPAAAIGATSSSPERGSAGRAFALLAAALVAGLAWVMAGRRRTTESVE